jgi:hypothetical protein
MKKLIPICIIGIVVLGGLGAVANTTSEEHFEKALLTFSEPTIQNENRYLTVSLKEANSFLMKEGKPLLPSVKQTFAFPFGTLITDVTVIPQNVQTTTITKQIEPTPHAVQLGVIPVSQKEQIVDYGVDPYPSTWYNYRVGTGIYDGELSVIVTVDIYPIQYQPAENTLQWTEDATVIIDYESSTPQSLPREDYQFVVIGPNEYSGQIAPLITHKIARGITSRFVSLENIYAGTYFPATGRDNQEKIKYFIKNAIENWLTGNILLVGGSSKVPVRETHVFVSPDDTEVFVSDLYYADIYNDTGGFCSWDSNNNNVFGEYQWQGHTDEVDLYPDVYLGRWAATSGSQVTACVNKVIGYETTPGYQQTWFTNLVVVGGDSFEDSGSINEGEYANTKVIDVMTGFSPDKQWVTNGKLTNVIPTGVANIKSAINAGCGFVDFSGHGNTGIWATHPHETFGSWVPTPAGGIRSSDITTLSNGNKLPIVTVEACSTAKFASDANCFNWAFMYTSNGGAIGTFGCTGLGYGYVGTGVVSGLIGKIGLDTYRAYKIDQAETYGELWAGALNRYITPGMDAGDYKTLEEWQAFGDPTLAIGEKSQPPAKPETPTGPASGKVGSQYTYSSSTTDPEGNQVSYMFDWGDGTFSSWIGPMNSGQTASGQKTWSAEGTYQVKVVAKDSHGVLSEWSDPLSISMPVSYEPPFVRLLERIFEQFPNAFPLLRTWFGF